MFALLIDDFVEVRRMGRLIQYFSYRAGLGAVLVRCTWHFLARSRNIPKFPHSGVVGRSEVDHGQGCEAG
jgi:hypothetical protein